MWRERKEQSSQELRIASAATPTNRPDQSFTARTAPHNESSPHGRRPRRRRRRLRLAGRPAEVAAPSTAAAGEPPVDPRLIPPLQANSVGSIGQLYVFLDGLQRCSRSR